ncbi:MAG: transposase [Nitrospirales bacterium]|nr:MAG: transposase [Nitrospirales bacterium]
MARQLRLEYAGALHHVTARGNAKGDIFRDDQDRRCFLDILSREVCQQRWRCYAYCLMDNHYHLLLETPEGNLSRGMRRLNSVYTQTFNRRHQQAGHVLHGRFKSILVEKHVYLLELCRYIVLNPVRAGLVRNVHEWKWSSYRVTAGLEKAPHWIAVVQIHKLFHRSNREGRRRYRQYVQNGVDTPSPWGHVRGQIFLGTEPFVTTMAKLVKRQQRTNVLRTLSQPIRRLTGTQVLTRVGQAYALSPRKVLTREHQDAYQCAAWLLRRVANEPLGVVADRFGVSPSRISHIQRILESQRLTREQARAQQLCHVTS